MRDWNKERSYVYRSQQQDSLEYNTYSASDHRPLVAHFRSQDR